MNHNWLKNFLKLKKFYKMNAVYVLWEGFGWERNCKKCPINKNLCVCVCVCIYCCRDVNKAAKPQAAGINKRLLIINRLEYLIYCTEASNILYYCIFPFFIFMYFSIQDHYSPSVLLKEPLFYRKIYYLEHWNIFS